jgi:tRNA/rRNA methyltransferase
MKTMGLSNLVLVSPKKFPDPEADTRATGAIDLLQNATITSSLDVALEGVIFAVGLSARQRDLGPVIGQPRETVARLLDEARLGDVALVFGNETVGLSNEEISRCQAAVTIPTNPEFSSLNLGSAVQVLCHECRMAAFSNKPPLRTQDATPFASPVATLEEVEGLISHFETVMTATGFFNPEQPGRLLPKLRRLFGRVRLEKDEINILRGILASTQVKTSHGRKE